MEPLEPAERLSTVSSPFMVKRTPMFIPESRALTYSHISNKRGVLLIIFKILAPSSKN
jgi:hypothetical protein